MPLLPYCGASGGRQAPDVPRPPEARRPTRLLGGEPVDRCDGRTTSFSQQRLWFLDQLRPGTADHLLPLALRLRGGLDAEALAAALGDVIDRHEVLRTRYAAADGEPVALV
ncbi:hypothetical protein G3I35_15115, partial [Streptomyces sp. SID10815]|nr:hypothetical protein [Streptomyces sp. SID10815]